LVRVARPLNGSTLLPSELHGRFYTRFSVKLPRVPLIVSPEARAKILNRVLAPHRPRLDVVEL